MYNRKNMFSSISEGMLLSKQINKEMNLIEFNWTEYLWYMCAQTFATAVD